jgi:LAGLIDADG endonuclease
MNNKNNTNLLNDPAYIEPFFVGLLEGDGSIVAAKSGNRISFSFCVQLRYTEHNKTMLECIQTRIGGPKVRLSRVKNRKDMVEWKASAKKDIANIMSILEKYPLLSSRKICQLEYVKQCLENPSAEFLLQTRPNRYDNQQTLVEQYKKDFTIPHYFGPWLSGFIEAEGCFSSTDSLALLIGQNHDWYLVNAIKNYFKSHHQIILHKDERSNSCQQHFYIAMGGHPTLTRIVNHITKYPLLGYKTVSYERFYDKFLALRVAPKLPFIDLQEQEMKNFAQKIQTSFGSLDPYLVCYFVGFFEGTGNIKMVKGRQLSGPCLYINLTHNLENERLLRLISLHIGGNVTVQSAPSKNQIRWVATSKKDVQNILSIFEKYPPLTSKTICQLEYLKQCLLDTNRSWDYHLKTRDNKYDNKQQLIEKYNKDFNIPNYFQPWLSGFIESEGSFKNSYNCLRVGINHDWYILNAIKNYFHSHHPISLRKSGGKENQKMHRYQIAIGSRPVLNHVIKHFEQYPLLGYKRLSYEDLVTKLKTNSAGRDK